MDPAAASPVDSTAWTNAHPGFNWKAGTFFIVYHALVVVTLPFYLAYHPPGLRLLIGTGVVLIACGVSLTTLYHRCYSHRAFAIRRPAELVLLFFATLIAQGSAIEWAFDHRRHHKHTEGPGDPHAITRGFWFAHVTWIFVPRPPLEARGVHDLLADPLLAAQHRHYGWWLTGATALVGGVLGAVSGDWLGALYLGCLVRMFMSHHATFCINSLAHWRGARPFDPTATACNSGLCSALTFGEGQHNYHHVFPYDYRIGDRRRHWDPGKWLIAGLAAIGQTSALKRAKPEVIAATRAAAIMTGRETARR